MSCQSASARWRSVTVTSVRLIPSLTYDNDVMMWHHVVILLLLVDYFAEVEAKGKHRA